MPRFVVLVALAVAMTASCGDDPDKAAKRADAVEGGQAASYILTEDELPDGWRHATGEQHLGIPKMCDVTLEPPALESVETQRFTRGFSGPFVIQYSFVSSDRDAATERVDEFVSAARTCTTYRPGKGVTIDVEPITDIDPVGETFAAVHGENTADKKNSQDFVVFRNGPAVTVLQSYSPATLADHATVAAMATAIDAKQR
jgi:hypothetical protein